MTFQRALLAVTLFLVGFWLLGSERVWARSNILVVQTDDMSARMFGAGYIHQDGTWRRALPRIQEELLQQGTYFPNVQSATPLCAPSRAALLTGRFSHSSGILNNRGAYGGWEGWRGSAFYNQNLATSLQESGYHTAHFGKFLNHYNVPESADLQAPPGWNRWVTDATDDSTRDSYGYFLLDASEGGASLEGPFGNRSYAYDQNIDPPSCSFLYESCNHHTDKMTYLAAQEIKEAPGPFYIQVDYHAPHGDSQPPGGPQPATRHIGTVRQPLLQKNPNFNEKNVQDKPTILRRYMRNINSSQEGLLRENYKRSLEAMMSVDEGVGYLIDTLRETGQLDDTYIFFFSDNGYFHGEHRFVRGKYLPYQASARVPLVVRGPEALPQTVQAPQSSLDITSSILDIANASLPGTEGRSLRRQWQGEGASRRAILTEYIMSSQLSEEEGVYEDPPPLELIAPAVSSPPLRYRSILVHPYRYTTYRGGGIELYNLQTDPYETRNLAYESRYQKTVIRMRKVLREYQSCKGTACVLPPKINP